MNNTTESKLNIPAAIILGALIIAGAIFLTRSGPVPTNKEVNTNNVGNQVQADIKNVNITGEPYVGNVNAGIIVAYWFDYQCPFCQRTDQNVIAPMVMDYVNQGKAKIVFKDFQFLGQDSMTAALAGRAVWEVAPDKYYAWHKAMFNAQGGENAGWASKENVLAITKTVPGINVTKVEALMTSKQVEYVKAIEADKVEGGTFGITGTPGMVIGSQVIQGSQEYNVYKQLIDSMLNK